MMQPLAFLFRNRVCGEMRRLRNGRCATLAGVFLFLAATALFSGTAARGQARRAPAPKASSGTPLSRGIALYEAERYDEALTELRAVVADKTGPGRALAYYYAARIRMRMDNLPAARKNLLAARSDSAGFHDAVGLLAWVNLKLGNRTDALIEWRQFVQAAGASGSGRVTVESITLPEEYRLRLAREALSSPAPAAAPASAPPASGARTPGAQSKAVKPPASPAMPKIAAPALASRDTSASAKADTSRRAPVPSVGRSDSAGVTLSNIDQRIESQIRRGYYGVGAAAALLLTGLAVIAVWMRRRRRAAPRLTFSATVDRTLDEVDREEGLLPDEERLEHEFETRRREIAEERPKPRVPNPPENSPRPGVPATKREERPPPGDDRPGIKTSEPERSAPEPPARAERSIFPGFESDERGSRAQPAAPSRSGPGFESERRPITEEVKALVARMSREGHSAMEIARIADLTRTEVELIVAVRARNMEQLIESASREEDEVPEPGALSRAIGEMYAEGRPTKEIARSLGISATEVNLALAMMEKKRGKRR